MTDVVKRKHDRTTVRKYCKRLNAGMRGPFLYIGSPCSLGDVANVDIPCQQAHGSGSCDWLSHYHTLGRARRPSVFYFRETSEISRGGQPARQEGETGDKQKNTGGQSKISDSLPSVTHRAFISTPYYVSGSRSCCRASAD